MNKELVTSLVDNEIKNKQEQYEILFALKSDISLAVDYKIQLLIKTLIREKVKIKQTPQYVRSRILELVSSEQKINEKKKSFLTGFFEKPAFTFATVLIVVFAIVLILFNRQGAVTTTNFAIEQKGSNNMFVQAKINFKSILDGKLTPQFISNNPEEIKNFFTSRGVKYQTQVPSFRDWSLLGAVVSEDKGEKFAHQVYVDKNNKILYLFQVNESYLRSHKIISLSNDLIEYLDNGKCYTTTSNSTVTLLTKSDHNIFAVVSNASLLDIENNFCNLD